MDKKKENENKKNNDDQQKTSWQEIISYLTIIVIVLVIKKYIVSPIRVNGESMLPTLKNKDYMILDKISYRFGEIKRFDIVVIKYNGEYLIKRVIGLPGERVEYMNNKLYVNGKRIKEKYTRIEMYDYNIEELGQKEIPEDCYFVLGDNRPNSKDSHIFGYVSKDDILGKSSFTLYPLNRFGLKK